jgi:hypothetical protein
LATKGVEKLVPVSSKSPMFALAEITFKDVSDAQSRYESLKHTKSPPLSTTSGLK